jgi:uncharacterized membrane protein SirB2
MKLNAGHFSLSSFMDRKFTLLISGLCLVLISVFSDTLRWYIEGVALLFGFIALAVSIRLFFKKN